MDLRGALDTLGGFFAREGAPYAVVGGLALAAHGIPRATFDLDLVTSARTQPRLLAFLGSLGYEALHVSAGYSNHSHRERRLPRVDVVYVSNETEAKLFAGVADREILPGVSAPVPRPEHLAAMKVLAMKNDPERRLQELADVQALRREVALSPADYEAFLAAFPEPPAEAMRARRGPRGEPFEL